MLLCLAFSAAAFSPAFFNPNGRRVPRVSGMRKTLPPNPHLPLKIRLKALKSRVVCSATADETLEQVPVIDFQGFVSGNAQEKEQVAKQIFNAFKDIGFVTLVNHGLEPGILEETFRSSRSSDDFCMR
eukprot:3632196-Rhodomonas_salina.2